MSSASWTCRRCLIRSLRPMIKSTGLRFQSSAIVQRDFISPALLNRARSITAEYSALSKNLAEEFDTKTAKRVGELSSVANALKAWENANHSLEELNQLLHDPSTDAELRDLASEDLTSATAGISSLTTTLTSALVPRHPFADLPCLLEIRPGAGGSEAAIFAGDLLRMYQAYCVRQGLRASLLKYEDAEGASGTTASGIPLAEAILEIEAEGAYDALRCEAGVHRVQRVPATESKGRTHTSAASVLVLPSFPSSGDADGMAEIDVDDPASDYYIDPKEVRTDIMRARGAGGQHVNTTDSAVRLTHLPTNTVVSMQDSRSQPKNREKAWQLLRAKLAQARREAREEEMMNLRRSVVGVAKMGRGDKVRTYNWGQQRVTDHRSGITVHNLDEVMEGGDSLEKVMDSVRSWLGERDVQGLIADEESAASAEDTSKKQ